MEWSQSFRMMAGYNRWMNEKLYEICATLPDQERRRNRHAFFKSIHGTLNHLLLTDRAWLGRFTGKPVAPPHPLDRELYADFEELRRERTKTDAVIEDYCRGLGDEQLNADLTYTTTAGGRYTHPLAPALVHFFNHQTHHRGQLTTLLSQVGIDPGVTDVIAYYRESAAAEK